MRMPQPGDRDASDLGRGADRAHGGVLQRGAWLPVGVVPAAVCQRLTWDCNGTGALAGYVAGARGPGRRPVRRWGRGLPQSIRHGPQQA